MLPLCEPTLDGQRNVRLKILSAGIYSTTSRCIRVGLAGLAATGRSCRPGIVGVQGLATGVGR